MGLFWTLSSLLIVTSQSRFFHTLWNKDKFTGPQFDSQVGQQVGPQIGQQVGPQVCPQAGPQVLSLQVKSSYHKSFQVISNHFKSFQVISSHLKSSQCGLRLNLNLVLFYINYVSTLSIFRNNFNCVFITWLTPWINLSSKRIFWLKNRLFYDLIKN